ncbi:proline-rich protein 2-like [Rousettus aegyptiacus]|uniref:proline-rich protein 2-like n=1 Tax=Rousettus aegyptiacus TaxID=9407 RepID=UPI00168D8B24|nr:proline-rich protein 2-like [Rousettus aegyptiacus]
MDKSQKYERSQIQRLHLERREGKRRRSGPRGRKLLASPPRHPERPERRRSRPGLAALPQRRPQPPALPDPPRTRFLRSRTPALASPREQAGQFSPLLGRGDSRGDVNTASPAARGPSPPPGSVTSSPGPAPRSPRAGAQRACPFLRLPLPDRCPKAPAPLPARRPVSPAQPPENPSANPGANNTGAGRGRGGRRRHSGQRGFIVAPSALPPTASAARALTCSPRRLGRPRRRFRCRQGRGLAAAASVGPASGGSRGLPGSPSHSTGRGRDKTPRAAPRSAPRPHRPTDPQPPRRRRRHRARRGEQWWPPPSPRSRPPPFTPRSAPPPRPPAAATRTLESASPTPPAPSAPPLPTRRGGAAPPVTAAPVKAGPAIYTSRGPPPSAPSGPPDLPPLHPWISPAPDPPTSPKPAFSDYETETYFRSTTASPRPPPSCLSEVTELGAEEEGVRSLMTSSPESRVPWKEFCNNKPLLIDWAGPGRTGRA